MKINEEEEVLKDISLILQQARKSTLSVINNTMVKAYWDIGQRIVQHEQAGQRRAGYGAALIKKLSAGLSGQFGAGFSVASLKSFRQFYLTFPGFGGQYALPTALSWSHLRLIMRLDSPQARQFYMEEAAAATWSVQQLQRNIQSHYFQRIASRPATGPGPKTGPGPAPTSPSPDHPASIFKDPYIFEFLNIAQPFTGSEREMESTLLQYLQNFLLELGKGFAFVGRQFRIATETADFYIDLVFYNYLLKCFVLFDLKMDKLSHADIGQLDMYVRLFDDLQRGADDQPTLGVILCADKDETMVKYSVMSDNNRLFAARYKLYLPSEAELIAEIERGRQAHAFVSQGRRAQDGAE